MPFVLNRKLLILILLLILVPILSYKYKDIQNFFSKAPSPQVQQLACPVNNNLCKNGQDLIQNGIYMGFSLDVPAGTPIMAALDGNTTVFKTILPKEQKSEKLVTIYLDSIDGKTRAVYFYKGEWSPEGSVKRGNLIGKSSEKIEAYNTSLLFQIIKGDIKSGIISHLTSLDFTN